MLAGRIRRRAKRADLAEARPKGERSESPVRSDFARFAGFVETAFAYSSSLEGFVGARSAPT